MTQVVEELEAIAEQISAIVSPLLREGNSRGFVTAT
jgi:hypothetical protein